MGRIPHGNTRGKKIKMLREETIKQIKKEEELAVFNMLDYKRPWGDAYRKEFMLRYAELAISMDAPILERIDNSALRKSIKVIKKPLGRPIIVKPLTPYVKSIAYNELVLTDKSGKVSSFVMQASAEVRLGRVIPESIERMVLEISESIISQEIRAVEIFEDVSKRKDMIMYIIQDFHPHEDPTVIRTQKITLFGWEEIALVGNMGE